jgi:FAD/FMN-containing dehydrogenase
VTHASIPETISTLRGAVSGRVITPGDADYDATRAIFLGGFDRRPAVIVRPVNAADVAAVIVFARDSGLPFSIRSGGHSGALHSTNDDGIVLDVRDMRAIEIDAKGRTAWAETGLCAVEYSKAVAAHGLATGFGDTGSVGIGGITLAGGIGYLVRKHGMTIDSVRAAEIVTADGDRLTIDDKSHPDLFWAIRGGGGNFGVVTRIKYALHPVNQVVGGMLMLPATPDVITGLVEASAAAPEEVSAIVNVMTAPPMPFVPAEHHGKLVVMLLLCCVGEAEFGAGAVAPFRALGTPIVDMIRPITYPELFPPDDPSFHPTAVGRTMFADRIGRPEVETILDFLGRSDAPMRVAQIRVLGGAMARVPADATAFAHRDRPILVNVAAFYTGPQDRPAREQWTAEFAAALRQGSGGYVAFMNYDDDSHIRAAYPPATLNRLAAVKARYDPANVFRRNHNVPPAR